MKQEIINKLNIFFQENPTMLGKAATTQVQHRTAIPSAGVA